ncbi:MAG: PQQ-dependent sugar dehydrogenase [Phycisphaeraceae bacterium]|nr:PQQ-dependent sugar dehydrogenase [Phycisphaerales bacterium]MCB9861449.1 PQQ-dependent sugar dehydrogenase [Phycisphaeraceae bacterium]
MRFRSFWNIAGIVAAGMLPCATASGQTLTKELVGTFSRPVVATHAPGDMDRLFVVEQHTGRIEILDLNSGTVLPTPFLTISGLSTGNEQGLLGLAFHPDYAANGYFYVNYTASGQTFIRRYSVSAGDPNVADPSSANPVLQFSQPFSNHNGGWIGFEPGFNSNLYIAAGDGGSANDPLGNGQSLGTLLGKILRIDVDGDDFPTDPNANYAIPASNPFGVGGPRQEIWAYGLRNPWRCSFDRMTGDFWIGDVGQGQREEVDFQPASSTGGENYGWRCMEGTRCTGLTGCTCNAPELVLPVHEYDHNFSGFSCSITGGYVYRGCDIEAIRGLYFFADYCSDQILSLEMNNGVPGAVVNWTAELGLGGAITSPVSFGEDARGEMYICSLDGGVYRLRPTGAVSSCACYADCDKSGSLNVFDYICFGNAYAQNLSYADCDGSGGLNIFDYICYGNAYAAGCP